MVSPRLNIAILTQTLYAPGGAQRLACNLSLILSKNHNVFLVSFDEKGGSPHSDFGGTFHALGCPPALFSRIKPFIFLHALIVFCIFAIQKKVDMCFSLLWLADVVLSMSPIKIKKISIFVINIINNLTNKSLEKHPYLGSIVYRRFSSILAIAPDIKSELQDLFCISENRLHLFRNPVLIPAFKKIERIKNRFVFCGRLVDEKNLAGLLHVWRFFIGYNPEAQLLVIGDGPLLSDLAILSMEMGFRVGYTAECRDSNVIFIGSSDSPEMYISSSSALLIPSINEGVPTVAITAALLGTPFIAADSNGGGMRYLYSISENFKNGEVDKNPLLPIPLPENIGTVNKWVNSLINLNGDEEYREHLLSIARDISNYYDIEGISDHWAEIIKNNMVFKDKNC